MRLARRLDRLPGALYFILACTWLTVAGCGGEEAPPARSGGPPAVATDAAAATSPAKTETLPKEPKAPKSVSEHDRGDKKITAPALPPQSPRTLADLMQNVPDSASVWMPELARIEVDDAQAAAAGIHKLSSARLVLYTDMPVDKEIAALPSAFEQAFPQWCQYFGIDPTQHSDWQMTGFLMDDKSRFEKLGLLPDELPPFEHGFCRNFDFWVYEQPSAYYRRHLVLHEGTHGFMNTMLGSCGPPWYMEGMAELLATHRWADGVLTMDYMPKDRDEVPMWGRIKIVKDDFAAGRAQQLDRVLEYQPAEYQNTEPYAWCWAAAALLNGHPRYQSRFREMSKFVTMPGFNERFRQSIGADWRDLATEWQVFIAGLEYGYDVPAAAVRWAPGEPLPAQGKTVAIDAAEGWQSSGLRLEAGTTYKIAAEGRYQVADQPQVWWSEPGGVSIRYYQGRPLGMLLAAVRADPPGDEPISNLIRPIPVGLEAALTPEKPGTLYLRINDSAAELSDNAGTLSVEIKPMAAK